MSFTPTIKGLNPFFFVLGVIYFLAPIIWHILFSPPITILYALIWILFVFSGLFLMFRAIPKQAQQLVKMRFIALIYGLNPYIFGLGVFCFLSPILWGLVFDPPITTWYVRISYIFFLLGGFLMYLSLPNNARRLLKKIRGFFGFFG